MLFRSKQGTWPSRFNTAPSWPQPYYSFRDELSVEDGIVFRGAKILIPTALRPNYIQQLHKMHQSADSTLKLAKEYFYWPKVSEDIFRHVDQCSICNSLKPHQQKEPLNMHPVPSRPFEFVGTDLFDFNCKIYIVLVDSYSCFLTLRNCKHLQQKTLLIFYKGSFLLMESLRNLLVTMQATTHRTSSKHSAKSGTFLTSRHLQTFPEAMASANLPSAAQKTCYANVRRIKQTFAMLCYFSGDRKSVV